MSVCRNCGETHDNIMYCGPCLEAMDRAHKPPLTGHFQLMLELNKELQSENAQLKDEASREFPKVCHWSEDADGIWNGSCGIAWSFEYVTTPKENNMNHCPQCGAVLIEVAGSEIKEQGI